MGFGPTAQLTPVSSGLENITPGVTSITITVNQPSTAYRILATASWCPVHIPLGTKSGPTAVLTFDAPCPSAGGQAWWAII